MSVEKSHGKARPTLPRASDLRPAATAGTARERRRSERDESGRATVGNTLARGRGWKRAIARMLGHDVAALDGVAATVAEDAWRVYVATLRELPHAGPTVRGLVASMARHRALEGFYAARALAALGSPAGDAADEQATKHGQRAERLAVTCLDVARVLAAHDRQRAPAAFPWALPTQPSAAELDDDERESTDGEEPDEPDGDPPGEGISADRGDGGEPEEFFEAPHDPQPTHVNRDARSTHSPAQSEAVKNAPEIARPVELPWVRSERHGGALMPRELAGPMPRATPPADLEEQLAKQRAQQALDDARRNGRFPPR